MLKIKRVTVFDIGTNLNFIIYVTSIFFLHLFFDSINDLKMFSKWFLLSQERDNDNLNFHFLSNQSFRHHS